MLEGFRGGSLGKNPPANTGDTSLIPGLGRSPGEEMATHPVFSPGKPNGPSCVEGNS